MLFKSSCYPVVKNFEKKKKILAGAIRNVLWDIFLRKHTCTVKGMEEKKKPLAGACGIFSVLFLRFMSRKETGRRHEKTRQIDSPVRRSHGDDEPRPKKRGSIFFCGGQILI